LPRRTLTAWQCRGAVRELRSGAVPVRIQILAGTAPADAVRVLRKLLEWYESDPNATVTEDDRLWANAAALIDRR
jgi:hypothetical protein